MDRESPGATTILFRAPKETEYTGAYTPCRAATSAPTSAHSRQGGPVGWGSTAYVPGAWTVQRGHDLVERVEASLCEALPGASVFTHLEPAEDPRSFADTNLDRPR